MLFRSGFDVLIASDAVIARDLNNRDAALAQMRALRLCALPAESFIFGWLHTSKHPAFGAISKLVKASDAAYAEAHADHIVERERPESLCA